MFSPRQNKKDDVMDLLISLFVVTILQRIYMRKYHLYTLIIYIQLLFVNHTVTNLGENVHTLESGRPGVEYDLECHHGRLLKDFKPWFLHHVKRNLKLNELVNIRSLI